VPEKVFKGILSTIGNSPLVELENLMPGYHSRIFAKMERFNPGGSIKDRTAARMLLGRIRSGELQPGRSVVIESSSGNLAIGLAQICRYYGIDFICVVDAKTTEQNRALLRAYGAKVEIVADPDPVTGEYLPLRRRRVRELVEAIPHAYSPDQYANQLNPRAHWDTMREIAEALDGRVEYLLTATSTTGTLLGCAGYAKANNLATTMVAVDAIGSVLYHHQRAAPVRRLIPGHGASVQPELLDPTVADRVVHVGDLECVMGCRLLMQAEAILAGGSSGATVAALRKISGDIRPDSNVVLVFADGGDRYLDTIYSNAWVNEHFGDVSFPWEDVADGELIPG
jgi:2,3-diaminopropionate biosynthesis protein SbnA